MAKTEYFKESILNAGTVKHGDQIPFEFELNDGFTKDNIEYFIKGCGARTTAKFEKKKVKGTIDTSKLEAPNEGNNPFNRGLVVYIKDGLPEFEADPDTLERKYNPDKKKERLQIQFVINK